MCMSRDIKAMIFLCSLHFSRGAVGVISLKVCFFFLKIRIFVTAVKGVYTKSCFSLMKKVDPGLMETLIMDSQKNHFLFSGITTVIIFMFFQSFSCFL